MSHQSQSSLSSIVCALPLTAVPPPSLQVVKALTVVKGSAKAGKVKSAHGKSIIRGGKTSKATIPSGGPSFTIYFDMEDTEGSVCDGSALSVSSLPDNEQGKFKAKSIYGVCLRRGWG